MKKMTIQTVMLLAVMAFCISLLTPANARAGSSSWVVNINTASVEELQLLPGIGLSKAKAIIKHRNKSSFSEVEDLAKVKGIGKALLSKVRSRVTLKGKTTAQPKPKKKKSRKKK